MVWMRRSHMMIGALKRQKSVRTILTILGMTRSILETTKSSNRKELKNIHRVHGEKIVQTSPQLGAKQIAGRSKIQIRTAHMQTMVLGTLRKRMDKLTKALGSVVHPIGMLLPVLGRQIVRKMQIMMYGRETILGLQVLTTIGIRRILRITTIGIRRMLGIMPSRPLSKTINSKNRPRKPGKQAMRVNRMETITTQRAERIMILLSDHLRLHRPS
mmetsp:Transcript_86025/g.135821  ORF Transcript_86025/g.135821 Transcript_86025/m.135821 type:complete len:215 (+) Transcript_86025:137-781(+)